MTIESSTFEVVLAAIFWCCAAGVAYAYAGYPVLIYALSRILGRRPIAPPEDESCSVALIVAAHNEAEVLEQRIHNALAQEYHVSRFQVVIASDGSDDGTAEICERYRGRIVPLLFPQRRGKAATLNAAVAQLNADVIVLSDANTQMAPDAVRKLVRWFADPTVGAVCGRLVLTDPTTGRNADSLYWRYETLLKSCEGRLGGPLGANGAIYAIRRHLFSPLPSGTIVDDFVIPPRAKLQSGCRIVYDADAIANEETAPDLGAEFRRRARIGVGGWQALGLLWPLLTPRFGWTAFALWSHKVVRWACPFLLVGAMLSSLALSHHWLYVGAAVTQTVFYLLCIVGGMAGACRSRFLRLCSMFAAMHVALLLGFFRWVCGTHSGIWQRTPRLPNETT